MEKTEKLFDKIYGASKAVLDAVKKPLIERQLKRRFQSGYDSAEDVKIKAEADIQKIYENIEAYDLNKALELEQQRINAEATKKLISEKYEEMFGEKIN